MITNLDQKAAQYRAAKLDAMLHSKKFCIKEPMANKENISLSRPIPTSSHNIVIASDQLTEQQADIINKAYDEIVGDGFCTSDKWITLVNKVQQSAGDLALPGYEPPAQSPKVSNVIPTQKGHAEIRPNIDELLLVAASNRQEQADINHGQNSIRPSTWDDDTQPIIEWFTNQTNDSLPKPPYQFDKARIVQNTQFYESLRSDIKIGPSSARAKWGALQADLKLVKSIFYAGVENGSMSDKVTLRTLESLQKENVLIGS